MTTKDQRGGKEDIPRHVENYIKDIVWMARRYAEGRKTYAPTMFNDAYKVLRKHIEFNEKDDPDNRDWGNDKYKIISNFPWATAGDLEK